MADSSVLKEYLIQLGFKVDAAGEGRFKDAAKSGASSMGALASSLSAAALGVSALLTTSVSKLNSLALSTQRVASSGNSIKSFQFAIQQMGGTAEGAMASLEGMAQRIRDMPGHASIFKGFGVDLEKETDLVESVLKVFNSDKFKAQPYSAQKAFSDALGLDDQTFRAMRNPEALKAYQEQRQYLEKMGVELDKSSKNARELSQELNKLYAMLEGPVMKIAGEMAGDFAWALRAVNIQLKELSEWYSQLPKESRDTIDTFAKIAGYAAAIAASLGTIKVAGNVLKGVGSLLMGGGAAAGGGAAGAAGGGAAAGAAGGAAAKAAPSLLARTLPWLSKLGGGLGLYFHSESLNAGEDEWARQNRARMGVKDKPAQSSPPATAPSGNQPRGIRNNNPGNIDYTKMYAEKFGAQKEGGPNARFSKFQSPEQGLAALATQIKRYANAGYSSVADIISKWAPPNENNTKGYISSVASKLGVDASQKLDLSNEKTMAAMIDAVVKHENGRNPYSSALISDAARIGVQHQGKFGGGWGNSPTINQKTSIVVNGASDPQQTARSVVFLQNDVNATLVRNMTPAAR